MHDDPLFDALNWWTATLLLAVALDINRPPLAGRKPK
jgi:hypothetical protein